jgi:hypothetical protein
MTADKAVATMPADILNATGINTSDKGHNLAAHSITGTIDARRRGRQKEQLGPELSFIEEQRKNRIRIFNVGPFPHTIPCGSAGTFYIPACPQGKPYVEMLTPLYAVETEIYPKGIKGESAKRLYDEGRRMAVEILGEGRSQDKKQSKRRVGVFIAEGDAPTKQEIDDACRELTKYCGEQILWMDALWDRDRKLAHDVYRSETFGACARVLGLTGKDKGWLAQGEPSNKVKCEGCHSMIDPDAPICYNCKSPANLDAYRAYREKLKSMDDDVRKR